MKKNTVQEYMWSDLMQNQVVLVSFIERTGKTARIKAFCGTAFFIGKNGYVLTAKHILPEKNTRNLAISILGTDKAKLHETRRHAIILDIDCHPTADIAIIKTGIETWHSIFQLNTKKQCPNARYQLTGYPLPAETELTRRSGSRPTPCIRYNIGYIRKYLAEKNQDMPETAFYELDKTAGPGSPVFQKAGNTFKVIGVYIGEKKAASLTENEIQEKTNEKGTDILLETAMDFSGIAIPASSFCDWAPKCLGHTILQEMNG